MSTAAPLVSFVVFAFKQERYIREAVRSALAQSYEPMEILLTDDHSPDGTYEVIEEEVAAYKGPHKVIVNRNEKNLGLTASINRAFGCVTGEFVVVQGGDDISLPHRVTTLVDAWRASEPRPDLLWSHYEPIGEDGNPLDPTKYRAIPWTMDLEQVIRRGWCGTTGATTAYSRKLIRSFGPIDGSVVTEDLVFPFRAMLGTGIRFVDTPLIQYRIHGNSISSVDGYGVRSQAHLSQKVKMARNDLAVAQQWVKDWRWAERHSRASERRLRWHVLERHLELSRLTENSAVTLLRIVSSPLYGLPCRRALRLMLSHVRSIVDIRGGVG